MKESKARGRGLEILVRRFGILSGTGVAESVGAPRLTLDFQ